MYGLVNMAIRDMITSGFGAETWSAIRARVDLDDDQFEKMAPYPDELTYGLVQAACEETGLTGAQALEAFGEYWILYTVEQGYGDILKMAGSDLWTFLHNLNSLHAGVGKLLNQLQPPRFTCEDLDPEAGVMRLHYHSHRAGLAPMVVGLVKGLGKRFETEVEVEQVESRDDGAPHDVFRVAMNRP